MKKIISIALSLIIVITASLPVTVQAQTYVESLMAQGFPQSYAEKLEKLHEDYTSRKITKDSYDAQREELLKEI